jgi:hypothetical protein
MKKRFFARKLSGILLFTGCTAFNFMGCNQNETDDPDVVEPVFNEALYNLRLTEINYNPSDFGTYPSDSLEFIEIKNVGTTTLDLTNLEFTDGARFVFPDSTKLAGGQFFVVASNATAFKARYGKAPDGVFTDQLSNKSETIILKDVEFNEVIFSQVYADSGAWVDDADGKGYSLVTVNINPDRQASGPSVWRKSAHLNGSPGADDIIVAADPSLFGIRITEIHYNPLVFEGTDGDSLEFIELKNTGSAISDLGRVAFVNGITYTFPSGSKMDANQIIVLVSDIPTFKRRYPTVTPFGAYTGQLSNTGEKIVLADVLGDTNIVVVDYKDTLPWPAMADGGGASIVPVNPSPDADQDDPSKWRMSFSPNGSPGADDAGVVVINEILTHTDAPLCDAIELYNPGTATVNIGGWYLTDSKGNPAKYRIPDGTEIEAGKYKTFDTTAFNADPSAATSFTLNAHGESLWLFSNVLGCNEGYCHGVTFGELENGVSIGRLINSQGQEFFVPQKGRSFGEVNQGPLVGPLVISEIMYHSIDDAGDYIEVTNVDIAEISLSHPSLPDFTWRINGVNFFFPANAKIKANESVIIASDSLSIDAFRTRYSLSADVQVFQMTGDLQNGSETLKLEKPEDPYVDNAVSAIDSIFPYMTFDEVDYSDQKPWPSESDGNGMSLQRVKGTFGNDVANWKAAIPTPGKFE